MPKVTIVVLAMVFGVITAEAQRAQDVSQLERDARATVGILMDFTVNTPEVRRAQARVREAEAKAYGTDIQVAASRLQALELKLSTPAMRELEIRIDRVRTDLIGATKDLKAMSPELLTLLTELEIAQNNSVTPEVAESRVRLQVLQELALTDDLERARRSLATLLGSSLKAPELPPTAELLESRRKRDTLMEAATQANPDAARAKAHAAEVRARLK